jgi:hypothetical protein
MDIQDHQGPERSKRAFEQTQRARIDANRAIVRAARENLEAVARAQHDRMRTARSVGPRRDVVDLSATARAVSEPSTAEREARVRELADAHRMERLHTPERLERAAQRLLEG